MKEKATVLKIENGFAELVCTDSTSCKSCEANSFCGGKERTFPAKNPRGLDITSGSRVEVYLPPGKTISSAFWVMIFPLIVFFIFFWLSGFVLGIENEGPRALAGVVGMGFGFAIAFFIKKKRVEYPEIIRLLSGEGSPSEE